MGDGIPIIISMISNKQTCDCPRPVYHTDCPLGLGSHTKSIFLLYLPTRPITCSSRLCLHLLLPDAIACSELYESLNILMFLSEF